jgi:phosphoribosylformylglycinamidine (FGAM) synthase PurS component
VAKIVVDVMLKPEIHDPQGEAIAGACHRLGFTEVVSVRQGKRFEVEVEDPGADGGTPDGGTSGGRTTGGGHCSDAGTLAIRVAELAAELLANPIIEEFAIHDA